MIPWGDLGFQNEKFLKRDTPESVELFKEWWNDHSGYQIIQGEKLSGKNMIMYAAARGNIHLLTCLIKCVNAQTLNMWSGHDSVFDAVLLLSNFYDTEINKVIECVKILINAGADINAPNFKNKKPLDVLLDKTEGASNECVDQRLLPLIKLYIQAGAQCQDTETQTRTQNKFLVHAQQEILDVKKITLLHLAKRDRNSTMAGLPEELFSQIANHIWEY